MSQKINIKDCKKQIKYNDLVVYKLMKNKMSDPTVLTNELIRHYQWILLNDDLEKFDLSDEKHLAYKDLFIYAISDKYFLNEYFNYFIFSIKIAFDASTKKWSKSLISDILVDNKRVYDFDLVAMYILIASAYDRVRAKLMHIKINKKINIDKQDVIDLFDKIVDQKFYNELKTKVIKKRSYVNSIRYFN